MINPGWRGSESGWDSSEWGLPQTRGGGAPGKIFLGGEMSEPGPEGSRTIRLKVGMGSVPSRRNSIWQSLEARESVSCLRNWRFGETGT